MTNIEQLPTFQEFKAMDQTQRNQLLRELRKNYSGKQIKDAWGISQATLSYYVKLLKKEEKEWESAENASEQISDQDGVKSSSAARGPILDAEYTVIEDDKASNNERHYPAVVKGASSVAITDPDELPIMNFKDVVGTLGQLEKRLGSILTLLEMDDAGQEKYRLNIQVYKA